MINFAEELTYWYLRLNGFFLLQNFVLHHLGKGSQRATADSDLLAIRHPYVYEKIGGQEQDWDQKRFEDWDIKINKFNLAFIVEVKSGRNIRNSDIKSSFSLERLKGAIYRFGIFQKSEVPNIAEKLSQDENRYINGDWIVAKLAVTNKCISGPWLNLLLSEADKFIQERIKSYLCDKYPDRIYFPNALMQYLTWKKA